MPNLNDILLKLRTEKGVLQKDVATAIGLSLLGYQRYEYGTRKPTSDILVKLADYYNVSLDYLVGRSNDPIRR